MPPERKKTLARTDRQPRVASDEVAALEMAEEDVALASGADEWVGETVQPRDLIPTEREVEAGSEVREHRFEMPEEPGEDLSFRERVRRWGRDLDPRRIEGPKLPLVVLALLPLIAAWDDAAIGVLAPEIQTEFGVAIAFMVALTSVIGALRLVLAPPGGYLADRIKRVWMVRAGAIVANLASIWQGFAPGVGQLVGSRFVAGLSDAVYTPASYPLLTDYFPSRARARVFSALFFAAGIGGILGPPIAGNLGEAFGWRTAVITLGVLATGVSLLTFLLKEPTRGHWDRIEMGAREPAKEQEPVGWTEAWRASAAIVTLRRLWFAEPFLYMGGAGLLILLPFYYAQVFLVSPAGRGYLATIFAVAGLLGLAVGAPIADRLLAYRPGRVMTLLSILGMFQAGTFLVLGLSPSLVLSVAATLPMGFIGAMITPALFTLLSMVIPARMRGLGIQTSAPFRLIGVVALPVVVGLTGQWGLRGSMFALAPIVFVGAVIVATAALGVERDIRAAKAASIAEDVVARAQETGRAKMLVCRDVDVTYEGTQVLFNVDLDVDEGEMLALLGTNGAGKSTLLRAISGIHEASNGAIFFDGRDITHLPPHDNAARGVVMIPGGRAIFPTLSVEENLKAATWLRGDVGDVDDGFERVFGFFPILKERLGQTAGNLSGGEQQMLALGQAFLMKPRLLMIDELSLGLAPAVVQQLLETVRAINDQGTTVIVVEQSINVALTLAERAVFMEKGEIRFDGPTQELLRRPDLVRAVFFGVEGARPRSTSSRRTTDVTGEKLLKVEGVEVAFGGVQALAGVDLELSAGEILGAIGPNGAGKTTLFDVISGFVRPDAGSIYFEAEEISDLGPDGRARLGLGRSFQNVLLFPTITVRENIAVALERHLRSRNPLSAAVWSPQTRRSERRAFRRVDELIDLLDLDAYADKFVDELSTGTRRAVDIACVLAAEPRVLLLDEPSSGLAQAETEEMGPVLTRLVRETGCGLLVIEHDMALVSSISHRMVAMELGRVIASGEPEEVLSDRSVVASYLSASSDAVSEAGTLTAESLIENIASNGGKRSERKG
jgi:ABC-type branched-subunit amino acid transport system ATPase component/MFS family permease